MNKRIAPLIPDTRKTAYFYFVPDYLKRTRRQSASQSKTCKNLQNQEIAPSNKKHGYSKIAFLNRDLQTAIVHDISHQSARVSNNSRCKEEKTILGQNSSNRMKDNHITPCETMVPLLLSIAPLWEAFVALEIGARINTCTIFSCIRRGIVRCSRLEVVAYTSKRACVATVNVNTAHQHALPSEMRKLLLTQATCH